MVVTDDQVQTALEYLSADPHPLAEAEFRLAKAKMAREQRWAEIYLETKGTVGEREARIEIDNEYGDLRYLEEQAFFNVVNEKQRTKGADAIIEVWRTQNANARAAERVR